MSDKLQEILTKVKDWWNKFTAKQKSIIVGIAAVVIFTFAIIVYILSQPQYIRLTVCDTTAQAAEVISILDGAGIAHRESRDGLTIEVEASQESAANVAIGAAGYVPNSYSPDEALSGGLSTTAADKEKLWGVYLEKKLEDDLAQLSAVKSARVRLHIPEQVGTLIEYKQDSSAYIQLELDGTFTSANAASVAKAAQTFLGNENTANITIIDSDSNLLFSGEDDYSTAGIANSMLDLQNQAENLVASQVKKVLIGTNQFHNVEVASHLTMDYSNYEETVKEYYANEGREEGMKAQESIFESENENSGAAVPGAESNDGTVMVNPDYNDSSSAQNESEVYYLPNESSKYKVTPAGSINYKESSVSIAMIKYKEIHQEDIDSQGLLDGISWEEYKAANSADVKLDVDPDFYSMVSNATSIEEENITIVAYETPVFYDKAGLPVEWTDVFSVVMLVAILGLLAFVILRSMHVQKEVTDEEELSVEDLLQSTPEAELEDIDVEAKSEIRKLIEKFVDENPEAAAALLRNWLNADWV